MEWIAQSIGIVAMCFNVLSFQFKNKQTILACQLIGGALFAVNYFLLNAVTGGLLNTLGVIRAIVFLNRDSLKKVLKPIIGGFIALFFVSYILTFTVFGKEPTVANFLLELLPVIGMTAVTFGFAGKDAKTVRVCGFINSPCWLIYNCLNFAIGAILCEVFSIVSLVSAFIRLDLKRGGSAAEVRNK